MDFVEYGNPLIGTADFEEWVAHSGRPRNLQEAKKNKFLNRGRIDDARAEMDRRAEQLTKKRVETLERNWHRRKLSYPVLARALVYLVWTLSYTNGCIVALTFRNLSVNGLQYVSIFLQMFVQLLIRIHARYASALAGTGWVSFRQCQPRFQRFYTLPNELFSSPVHLCLSIIDSVTV